MDRMQWEVERTAMVMVDCPWCDGQVAMDASGDTFACTACALEVAFADERAVEPVATPIAA